ncbi:MAG TPA: hypothetical protein PK597_03010 [Oscillospiraceae bacterium]|nr:hypothetical protein [Oscillospiraceae bacterium]
MTYQRIGARRIALFLSRREAEERGFPDSGPDAATSGLLARDILRQAEIPLDGPLEVETFPDAAGILLFAHVKPPERPVFVFPDLESLIRAAHALPRLPEKDALTYARGRYFLALPPEEKVAACCLSEFAESAADGADGDPILSAGALSAVKKYFAPAVSSLDSHDTIF